MKNSSLDFKLQWIQHPIQLGTPFQSSKFLVNRVVEELTGKTIVELGAGTGPVTRGILDYLPEDGKLISFEINPALFQYLQNINDRRLAIVRDSAENIGKYVDDFDCVVSGLPLTSLRKDTTKKILERVTGVDRFIQYKYASSRRMLEKYFSHIRVKREWRNFPPAVIYVCQR